MFFVTAESRVAYNTIVTAEKKGPFKSSRECHS